MFLLRSSRKANNIAMCSTTYIYTKTTCIPKSFITRLIIILTIIMHNVEIFVSSFNSARL